jgi:hypothetical protein
LVIGAVGVKIKDLARISQHSRPCEVHPPGPVLDSMGVVTIAASNPWIH